MARANAFTSQKTQQQQQQEPWPRCTIIFGLRQLNEATFHTVDRSHWAEIMYANIFGNVGQPSSVSPFTLPVVKKKKQQLLRHNLEYFLHTVNARYEKSCLARHIWHCANSRAFHIHISIV